jgi:4-alpha-glucanotransferase
LLISLEQLREEGLLPAADAAPWTDPTDRVDFSAVEATKLPAVRRAAEAFARDADATQRSAFDAFCAENGSWLDDYALFMAAHEEGSSLSWLEWEPKLAARDPGALHALARGKAADVQAHRIVQFLFWRQWAALRAYANARGIRMVGDIPIFVALDSADVWSRRGEFWLDEHGRPTVVSGVPPDYFSPTGQRWGNPLYRWDVMAAGGFRWWIERFRHALRLVDVIRIDHFRGFQACWEVPAHHETAIEGHWAPGPGRDLFLAARAALGELPIIVEDLGLITDDVIALREGLGYPGMKVLHFAFDSGPTNPFLPHWYAQNLVVYTGTHDNDTTLGWFQSLDAGTREYVQRYLRSDGHDIVWDLIRLALASVADTEIVPVQDVVGLGSEARMNYPGRAAGNWAWRLLPGQLNDGHAERLRELTDLYGRGLDPETHPT